MVLAERQIRFEQARNFRQGEATALRRAPRTDAREYLAVLRQEPEYQEARKLAMFERWEKLGQRIPEFSPEVWEEAGRVFSGVNNGVKAALLVVIAQHTQPRTEKGPGTYMSVDDIVNGFKELFTGTEFLENVGRIKSRKSRVISYCKESLCDVGLLTTEYNLEGELIGFGITREGVNYAVPAALLVLSWENHWTESLHPILGSTHVKKREEARAPLTRIKTLDFLVRHPYDVRVVDVLNALRVKKHPSSSTDALHKFGLIGYKSYFSTGRMVQYEVDNSRNIYEADYVGDSPELHRHIVEIISELTRQKNNTIRFSAQEISTRLPEEVRKRWKIHGLKNQVSELLSRLSKQGFLSRVDNFEGGEKYSDILLTEKGRSLFMRVILPTLFVISRGHLSKEQQDRINAARNNLLLYTQTSAELYYPHSQSSKIRKSGENLARVLTILVGSEQPQTARDLATQVGLSRLAILTHLSPAIKGADKVVKELNGTPVVIEITKVKGVNYYQVKKPQETS